MTVTVVSATGPDAPTPTPTDYPTPSPTATPEAVGEVTLAWVPVPDRYDFRRYVCRRISGATPTTSPTGGTDVPIPGATTRTTARLVDSPGSGTWSYSLFVAYDEYGSGTDERWSEVATVSALDVLLTPTPTPTPTPSPTPSPSPSPTPTP